MLPLFTSRRRKPVTCGNCGRRLEVVYPGPSYYTLALASGLLLELSVLPVMLLVFLQRWMLIGAIVGAFLLASCLATVFLNRAPP